MNATANLRLLAVSGSLRSGSSNTVLLEAAARLAPSGAEIQLWRDIAALPHFNPDIDAPDAHQLPATVADLRRAVGNADGLLLSTPEYARGLPGAFKNALDWLVGSLEFPGKRVAVISPSARSTHAQAQLELVLTTMSARLIDGSPIVIPLPSRDMTVDAILGDQALAATIRSAMADIVATMRAP